MIYIHNLNPVLFQIGPLTLHWYGLAYLTGFLFCRYWVARCYRNDAIKPPLSAQQWDEFLIWGIFATIIGGRLGYVLFYHAKEFFSLPLHQWWRIFAIWQGGMAFHGAALLLLTAGYYFCRKYHLRPLQFMDQFCRAAPLAIFFGRIANFINGELIGRPITEPNGPAATWGVIFPKIDNIPRHPSQIYEALLEGLLLFLLLDFLAKLKYQKTKHKIGCNNLPDGIVFLGFFIGYGITRFIAEFFRAPSDGYGFYQILPFITNHLTQGQNWSLVFILTGLGMFAYLTLKTKK